MLTYPPFRMKTLLKWLPALLLSGTYSLAQAPATRPMAAGRAVPVLGPNQYAAIPNAWIAQPVEAIA